MALIVIDPCDLGFMPNEEGGTIKMFNIVGFPEGMDFLLPLSNESLEGLSEMIAKKLGKVPPKVQVAGVHEMPKGGGPSGQHTAE